MFLCRKHREMSKEHDQFVNEFVINNRERERSSQQGLISEKPEPSAFSAPDLELCANCSDSLTALYRSLDKEGLTVMYTSISVNPDSKRRMVTLEPMSKKRQRRSLVKFASMDEENETKTTEYDLHNDVKDLNQQLIQNNSDLSRKQGKSNFISLTNELSTL